MQGSRRNTGAYKSGAAEVDDEMRARAFEPFSRPGVPGGLLEARLGQKRSSGRAPHPQTGARAQQPNLLPTSLQYGTKRSPGTQQDI